jgi:hypothetical protein
MPKELGLTELMLRTKAQTYKVTYTSVAYILVCYPSLNQIVYSVLWYKTVDR